MKTDNSFFENQTKKLIDDLKSVCSNYGLGNDGNEYKVITQIFLYKFLNDKFIYEIKNIDNTFKKNTENEIKKLSKNDLEVLLLKLNENTAKFKSENLISSIFDKLQEPNFAEIFDNNLIDIANFNKDLFVVVTSEGQKILLFDRISSIVRDKPNEFCKAIVNKIINFSFENVFGERFDFFSSIFEYLIKDYNSNTGGSYAEYFTPHSVAKIISNCLVNSKIKNVSCYDPSAGSGTLLLSLANNIGTNNCTIYSQDISQKSSQLLRLNLILNNLVHSLQNVIEGNTLDSPYHKDKDTKLKKFDYIVSNPPFKLDFSDFRENLETKENNDRFFAGIPQIKKKNLEQMEIYLVFIQHILFSLTNSGKAAIVLPTGFLTSKGKIESNIKKFLIEENILEGVISMPSNIFATTGTNVSVIFINKDKSDQNITLIDASNLGEKVTVGKKQRTILSLEDEKKIVDTYIGKSKVEEFCEIVSPNDVSKKFYSFSAPHYFELKINHDNISEKDFIKKINSYKDQMSSLFQNSNEIENKIIHQLKKILSKK